MKDAASGDFINVGIAHDADTMGGNTGAVTLLIETGRKTDSGYAISQGYLTTTTNRVPSAAAFLLAWNAQGVTVNVNGIVLPGNTAASAGTIGTYAVRMSQPVISFAGAAKSANDKVDATFSNISFGG